MPNPFVKLWKYLTASANAQIDQRADPKIQIAQAIEAEQQRHQALANQAAAVLGNQRQLEMRLNRQLGEVEKLQASARQALVLADKTRAGGDEPKAARVRERRAGLRHPAGRRRAVDGGPQAQPRRGAAGRRAGARCRRAEPDAAADDARRAHQADVAAGAGEDAGARRLVAAPGQRAVGAGQHPEPVGGPRQDRGALRQRPGPGRARPDLGRGPDARGAEGDPRRRRRLPAGPDPRLDEWRHRRRSRAARPPRRSSRVCRRCSSRRPSSARPSRPSAPSSRPDARRPVSGPEYPPPSYTGSAGEASAWMRGAGTPPELPMGGGRRGPLPGHRARPPAAPSGSTAGRWGRRRPGPSRTSTAASPSRSTC